MEEYLGVLDSGVGDGSASGGDSVGDGSAS